MACVFWSRLGRSWLPPWRTEPPLGPFLLQCSAHWFGTLDMCGAWTAWLWRMDSVCMLLRTAATFCSWAVGVPAAALALHAVPLVVLAVTTWWVWGSRKGGEQGRRGGSGQRWPC